MQQFKNVCKLKATSDKQDEFHIYKMNCSALNGEPSYVFKTSHEAAELALKMDSDIPQGKDSAMNEEDAYMDGMHSRVKGFKSLSLWTYHPGMKCIMHLATMESEREDTESITLFLNLFNEVLRAVSGIENYKFNPIRIMCDEAGANFLGIEAALGKEFLAKTVSCQWHFRQCAKNNMKKVNEHEKETFKSLFNELCYTSTAHHFEKVSSALEAICE